MKNWNAGWKRGASSSLVTNNNKVGFKTAYKNHCYFFVQCANLLNFTIFYGSPTAH